MSNDDYDHLNRWDMIPPRPLIPPRPPFDDTKPFLRYREDTPWPADWRGLAAAVAVVLLTILGVGLAALAIALFVGLITIRPAHAVPINGLTQGGAVSDTDTIPICQKSTGCGSTDPLHQVNIAGVFGRTSPAFFVATSGNDSNAGTIAAPFATLGKCQTAMEGSTTKICYVRGGFYAPAPSTATATGCNNNSTPGNIVKLTHAGGDDGETFSYWPPDGVGSAVFDGQSFSNSTGIPTAFCVYRVKNVTVTGLTFRNFQQSALFDANWDANDGSGNGNTFSFNTVTNNGNNPAINFAGWVQNASAINNYINNVNKQGISGSTTQNSAVGGLQGLNIQGNVVINSCTALSDCGPVYLQDYQLPVSTSITIQGNYLYQSNASGSGGKGIYLDDGASNVTASGNVIIAGGSLFTCFMIHGGGNDVFQNNICDMGSGADILFYQQTTHTPGSFPMTGNSTVGNFIVCSNGTTCGNGYAGSNSPPSPQSNTGSTYWNYGAVSTVTTTGANGAASDSSPTNTNPGIACWAAAIPGVPVASYGPPGFVIPQTGTAPSWPHSC